MVKHILCHDSGYMSSSILFLSRDQQMGKSQEIEFTESESFRPLTKTQIQVSL